MVKLLIHILLTAVRHLRRLERTEQPTPVQVEPPAVVEPAEEPTPDDMADIPDHNYIQNHRFTEVEFFFTPNMGAEISPRLIVIHYTANGSLSETVKHFQNSKAEVSAHLIIGRDGQVVQMVPFNRAAWHAGISQWKELRSLNGYSIGIELVNWGKLDEDVDGNLYSWSATPVPKEEAALVQDANGRAYWWQKYTPEQIEVCWKVIENLCWAYPIEQVVGHEEVSPGRKIDPGPLFPIESFRITEE